MKQLLFLFLILRAIPLFAQESEAKKPNVISPCISMEHAPNCVTIDGTPSIDPEGVKQIFKWELGDGTVKTGKIIDHCYKKPGRYRVNLNIIDSESGIEKKNEAYRMVYIKKVPEIIMTIPKKGVTGKIIKMSAAGSQLKNCDISNYYWDFGDGGSNSGMDIIHTFKKPGVFKIQLRIKGNDTDCSFCGYKFIKIQEPDDLIDEDPKSNNKNPSFSKSPCKDVAKAVLYNHEKDEEVVFELNQLKKMELEKHSSYSIFAFSRYCFTEVYKFYTNDSDESTLNDIKSTAIDNLYNLKTYTLEKVYFPSGQSEITDQMRINLDNQLYKLNQNPFIVFEINSHTDSKANDMFNLFLSEKRAKTILNYIQQIDKELANNVFIAKGYGESLPVNKCINKVPCTESEHQQNRRTEFRIVGSKNNATIKKLKLMQKEPFSSRELNEYNEIVDKYGQTEKQGLYFAVQVGAFLETPDPYFPDFTNMDSLKKEVLNDNATIFYFGNFNTLNEAEKFRQKLSKRGIKDAFVFAFFDDKRMYLKELEKLLD